MVRIERRQNEPHVDNREFPSFPEEWTTPEFGNMFHMLLPGSTDEMRYMKYLSWSLCIVNLNV